MIILTLGIPGAGKATLAKKLTETYKFTEISTGELLRHEVLKDTELGLQVKDIMHKGMLVEDEIVLELVRKRLEDSNDIVFDGFPRNLYQAEKLEEMLNDMGKRIDLVLHLDIDAELMHERVAARRICPNCDKIYNLTHFPPKVEGKCDVCGKNLVQREDDKRENVEMKIKEYRSKTKPLIEFYKDLGLYKNIDASQGFLEIYYQVIESSSKFTERTF